MSNPLLFTITWIWIGLAVVIFIVLHFVTAPFGRHTTERWGYSINNKLGWCIMEMPSLLIMIYFFSKSDNTTQSFVWILFSAWILHYLNRTIIYPLRIKPTDKKMPVIIVCSAIFFNLVNAGINGYYLSESGVAANYNKEWLSSMHFIFGAILFITGIIINWSADTILIGLRKKGEKGYQIPRGFLFEYVSSPNLLGEIIEWSGFALMAWNLPALSFAAWTFANLVPRALNHHQWYKHHFPEYPENRKAVFPYIL